MGGTAKDDFAYGLDKAGNRLWRENGLTAARDEIYGYDTLNRLTAFDRGDLNAERSAIASPARYQDWSLDALGNWSSFYNNSATAQARTHNAVNEITGIDGSAANLAYDPAGNMTKAPAGGSNYRYEYDHLNRLTAVRDAAGTLRASYRYDALSRRIEKIDATATPSVTRRYHYGPSWQLLAVYEGGNQRQRFVWGAQYIDELLRRDRDADENGSLEETLFFSQDGNWNVSAALNASGQVVERYAYDPYGQVAVLNGESDADSGVADWAILGGGDGRGSSRTLADQSLPGPAPRDAGCLLDETRTTASDDSVNAQLDRTAVYGPVRTVVWQGQPARAHLCQYLMGVRFLSFGGSGAGWFRSWR